ncbi:MAG: hypothetical protein GIW95_07760 [Candidatus Eremiobacteraeota bacterium]|nr:hypothetical protein [Candidatus Eremiobacteraeota bacterium]
MKLEIIPHDASRIAALAEALGGNGRPAGAASAEATATSVLLDFDESVTSLRTIVDVVDVELAPSPGRRIVPLEPLGDETLANFASATLNVPDLDAIRLVETHLDPLLRKARG